VQVERIQACDRDGASSSIRACCVWYLLHDKGLIASVFFNKPWSFFFNA
jgi:hypothetical protein